MEPRSIDIGHPRYDPSSKQAPPSENMASASTTSPSTPTPLKPIPKKKNADTFWPLYLVGVAAVLLLAFFGIKVASSLVDIWTDLDPSPAIEVTAKNPTSVTTPETTPVVATNPEPVVETEPAPIVTEPVTPAVPVIDKAALNIKVLNGNGIPGSAATVTTTLKEAGFTVSSTGNARRFSYETSYVYYTAGHKEAADAVGAALSNYQITIEENSVAEGVDALVVVGAK